MQNVSEIMSVVGTFSDDYHAHFAVNRGRRKETKRGFTGGQQSVKTCSSQGEGNQRFTAEDFKPSTGGKHALS